MSTITGKNHPIFNPGLCRCCGTLTKCRILNEIYEENGLKEVYSEMIKNCFGLEFSYLNSKPLHRLICTLCINKLREALNFKCKVIQREQAFLQSKMLTTTSDTKIDCSTDVTKMVMKDQNDNVDDNVNVISDGLDDELHGSLLEEYYSMAMSDIDLDESYTEDNSFIFKYSEKHYSSLNPTDKCRKPKMSKAEEKLNEQALRWKQATNKSCIVKYSYACPFSIKFNHILCYYCNQYFIDPVSLREHVWSHDPDAFKTKCRYTKMDLTRIDCRLCSEQINDLDTLKRHLRSAHGKHCFLEVKNSIVPFKLKESVNKCTICDMEFAYFYGLVKHMNHHFSNFVCESCGAGFPERRILLAHAATHVDARLPCVHCGATFKSNCTRREHIQKVHKENQPVSLCSKCEASFPSSEKAKHMAEVHGESTSMSCTACGQTYNSRRLLSMHVRRAHFKVYRYQCDVCQKKFYCQSSLDNHMPTHTGERNFKCKVCEKKYPRLKTLKEHMRIHNNDRRFKCDICSQAFIQNCSLKAHMKSRHS